MKKSLVIVESPAKAKTIGKFLGKDFVVEASFGHVRDLPGSAAETPASAKGKPWARLGVDVDHDFEPLYIVPANKKEQVRKLKALMKDASVLYLATDEDREGEAIAWHLLQELKPGKGTPVHRMVFHEITKKAIDEALSHPRDLDQPLVDAQEARRILDRLYGFEVSEVLWRKVKPRLSAGRVQSVAVRLVVERERARMRFVTANYWDVDAVVATRPGGKETFAASLSELGGKRVASGKDFEATTGRLEQAGNVVLLDEQGARSLAAALEGNAFTVTGIVEKPFTQKPAPPFITSTLQQESARKLRFGAQRTMRLAQGLYENGFITYMRTDSTNLSEQAITAARNVVTELYGAHFLPDSARKYVTKAKGAQEAHEAIRPAGDTFRTPEQLKGELDEDQLRLYELIWKRTVASQMKDATGQRTTVSLSADAGKRGPAVFTSTGRVIAFPGFLRAYVEGSDDPEAELEEQEKILPKLAKGDQVDAKSLLPKGHDTQPPARFTEASLIKELEEKGIGRPSTYASILQTIQDRGYVWKKGTALVPTFTAFAVINLLEQHFGELVDFDFTAKMEQDLDEIAEGTKKATPWLKQFYFGGAGSRLEQGLKKRIESGVDAIDPRTVCTIPLGLGEDGQSIAVRVGRYGPYLEVGEGTARANIPEDQAPDELDRLRIGELLSRSANDGRVLGIDPASNKPIYVKSGRFGPYIMVGEMPPLPGAATNDDAETDAPAAVEAEPAKAAKGAKGKKGAAAKAVKKPAKAKKAPPPPKPRMASLWPGMKPESLTLEDALKILEFPKTIGTHPTTGAEIIAQDGKFGPYIKAGAETRSLEGHAQLASLTLAQAIDILAQPKRGRQQTTSRSALAELGPHPKSGGLMKVMSGKFGVYVTDGVVNATIPKGTDPATLTVSHALELLDAREAKLRDQGIDPRAPKPGKPGKSRRAASPAKEAPSPEAVAARPKKAAAGGKGAPRA